MLAELAVGDAIDGGRGHVEFPSGRWDFAKVLGEVTAGSDARCHEITFGNLVEDLMSARGGVQEDLERLLKPSETGSETWDGGRVVVDEMRATSSSIAARFPASISQQYNLRTSALLLAPGRP